MNGLSRRLLPAKRVIRGALERAGVLAPSRRQGDYLQRPFLRALGRWTPGVIFECGACDGTDTLRLRDYFGAVVHAFECNPLMVPALRDRLAQEPRVHLVERAVWDADTRIPFYPVVHTTQGGLVVTNPGASSCFRAVAGYHQTYVQTEMEVEALRLETYCAQTGVLPDLLCLDVQGAALRALRGLGRRLDEVKAVIIEIEHREIFAGEDLYPAVDAHLRSAGLRQAVVIEHDGWYNNYLYLRT